MDYAQLSTQVDTLIKSAGAEGGTTLRYNEIMAIDGQRELVVSHLKHTYDAGTTDMVNTKEVANVANDYKNLETTLSSSVADVRGKLRSADQHVFNAKQDLRKKEQVRDVLKILSILLAVVAVLYLIGGQWAWIHVLVLIVLLIGFGYIIFRYGITV
jgi:hypothetical protein